MTTDADDFARLSRVELAKAVRDGRLSREEAGRMLFDRADRRLRMLEARAAKLAAAEPGASSDDPLVA